MKRVGIVSTAQSVHARRRDDATPAELVYPVVKEAVAGSGLARGEIGFTCAGSADVLEGRPFSFGFTLDVAGAVPPIEESHVEGDGAWAAYEAWVRMQAGEAQSALVFAWGKSSEGSLPHIFNATLDPFYESPLGLDAVGLAALQARAWMDERGKDERALVEVVLRSRAAARDNPFVERGLEPAAPADSPYVIEPLRRAFLPPVSDGACAVVLVDEETAGRLGKPVAWIAGVAHATGAASLGARTLTDVPTARMALERAAAMAGWRAPEIAELHACFPHQELMLREALGLNGCTVNPSGGALAANPIMATGLVRLAEAASRIRSPGARRALAHASSGHCLQANMVWLLES